VSEIRKWVPNGGLAAVRLHAGVLGEAVAQTSMVSSSWPSMAHARIPMSYSIARTLRNSLVMLLKQSGSIAFS
jgi:hypothetical protein